MKLLILASCILAAATAAYHGPLHYPVIGPNGVPIEPHAVQAARANHLAALASGGHAVAVPYTSWNGVPAVGHNALPLDTPEVAAAKVQHYRDFAVAAGRNGVYAPLAAPWVSGHAYPVDTPEVQHAKAAHFAAHAEAAARNGAHAHYRKRRAIYGGYHIPVIGPNGVPVETPEVQAAKASHFAALNAAASRAGPAHYTAPSAASWEPTQTRYYGPLATIGPDGRPVETPEVQAATAYHLSAVAAARSGYYNHY